MSLSHKSGMGVNLPGTQINIILLNLAPIQEIKRAISYSVINVKNKISK